MQEVIALYDIAEPLVTMDLELSNEVCLDVSLAWLMRLVGVFAWLPTAVAFIIDQWLRALC